MVVATGEMAWGAKGRARSRPGPAAVRAWLWALVLLVVLMVGVGGATRLTGSGLSITEWRPVTGALPPLSDGAWDAEFAKYRDSSQYRNLNAGMSLGEFKSIYRWEWGHRQLGRAIGLAFFVPLAAFWVSGIVTAGFALRMLAIGALGGLQAAIGWIMVASGLEPGMVAVAPVKLALHLLVASLILVLLVWAAAGYGHAAPTPTRRSSGKRRLALAFLGLVLLQVGLGGLVAGSKAGLTYNTWPLMDGRLLPPAEALLVVTPWWENAIDNPALVQLNHRLVAYLVVAAALFQAWAWRRDGAGSGAARRAGIVGALAGLQAALGVATLLLVVPLWAGLAHQLLAMALVVAATWHARLAGTG